MSEKMNKQTNINYKKCNTQYNDYNKTYIKNWIIG